MQQLVLINRSPSPFKTYSYRFLKSIYQKPLDNLPTSIEPINFME